MTSRFEFLLNLPDQLSRVVLPGQWAGCNKNGELPVDSGLYCSTHS